MKKIIWFVVIIVLVGAMILLWSGGSADNQTLDGPGGSVASDKVVEADYSDVIQVDSPKLGQTISSPLTITGQARGTWYFEATFPIRLIDADGNIIVQSYATAQSDWMTTDFVPFTAQLNFEKISDQNATLILQKDNPSGLPEYEAQIEIPVYISSY